MDLKTGFLRKISKVKNKLSKVHINKLNLKRNEINCFGTKMDLNKSWTLGAMWAKHFKLRIS